MSGCKHGHWLPELISGYKRGHWSSRLYDLSTVSSNLVLLLYELYEPPVAAAAAACADLQIQQSLQQQLLPQLLLPSHDVAQRCRKQSGRVDSTTIHPAGRCISLYSFCETSGNSEVGQRWNVAPLVLWLGHNFRNDGAQQGILHTLVPNHSKQLQ